jgi:beta propeller repeat protein
MGPLYGHCRPTARFILLFSLATLALLLVAGLALGPPANGKSFSKTTTQGGGITDMSWSGTRFELFPAPTSAPGQRMPSIDGDLTACRVGSASSPNSFDIGYRFLNGSKGTWGGAGNQTQPAVSQGLIAGLDKGVVSVYDPSKGLAVPVSDEVAVPSAPAFAGDLVVWQDKRNGTWDIYGRRFDRATGQPSGDVFPICTAAGDQTLPAVDAELVVWQDSRNGDWDVFGYDVEGAIESEIAVVPGDQCRPDICGSVAVWQDSRRGNWDIYAYDVKTKESWPISTARGAQTFPAVSDQLIVWQDRQPRYVQVDEEPTARYTDPDIHGYSLLAREDLDVVAYAADRTWQTRPDVSGDLTVAERQVGARALGVTRVTAWRTFDFWAYGVTTDLDGVYSTNASQITFSLEVIVCPNPPVTEMSVLVGPWSWEGPPPDYQWEPFAPTKTVALDFPDGFIGWDVSLKDSAGGSPGSGGSRISLDTHGPSCWAPSAVTVKSGETAVLPFKVKDALSPQAKVTIVIKRSDGSVVTTLRPRWVRTGRLVGRSYLADLIKGTYTFEVTAADLAGNVQVRIGANTLTVR